MRFMDDLCFQCWSETNLTDQASLRNVERIESAQLSLGEPGIFWDRLPCADVAGICRKGRGAQKLRSPEFGVLTHSPRPAARYRPSPTCSPHSFPCGTS